MVGPRRTVRAHIAEPQQAPAAAKAEAASKGQAVSTISATRWQLLGEAREAAACVFCESGGPLVDTALELDGERRLYVCPECVTGLARTATVGSNAAEALRHEYESEIRERDERLRSLADQLGEQERQFAEFRELLSDSQEQLGNARILSSQAVGILQQIGQ
jgi:hypothetical protein